MQSYKQHFKVNFSLAFPVMLSQLGHILVGMADSMMVGRIGAVSLAAASLGGVIFHVLLTFGLGVSFGSTPLIAAADGEGDTKRILSIFRHSFIINSILGILLVVVVFLSGDVLYLLNQPDEVVEEALPYLYVVTISMIPLMVFQTFRQFFEGLSRTRPAMYISLAANIVNVILNYILIFGKLGFEPMGLVGAGIATLISRILMMVVIIIYHFRTPLLIEYRGLLREFNYSTARIRRILNIGIPAGLNYLFEVGAFGTAVIMMGWIGTSALAAHQIAINLAAITYMMASGLGAAAAIRVGNQLGKNDIPNLRKAAYTLIGMVTVFMVFSALLFIIGRDFLPTLYITDNLEVIEIASSLIVIAALFQLSDGIQVVALGALRGLEDTRIPMIWTFIAYGVIALPTGYLLAFTFDLGAIGVWLGLFVGLTVAAVSMSLRFRILVKKLVTKHQQE